MNKVYQMWYLLFIYYDFATVVNPFFRAVKFPRACQQNEHISVKKMKRTDTCNAVNCFSNFARVEYSIMTSHLDLHLLLLS